MRVSYGPVFGGKRAGGGNAGRPVFLYLPDSMARSDTIAGRLVMNMRVADSAGTQARGDIHKLEQRKGDFLCCPAEKGRTQAMVSGVLS